MSLLGTEWYHGRIIRSGQRWSLNRSRLVWVRLGRGKVMEKVLTHWGSLTYNQLEEDHRMIKLVLDPRRGKLRPP